MMFSLSLFANQHDEEVNRTFGLKTGLYRMASIDKLYSPFKYEGSAPFYGLSFGKEKPMRSNETILSFSNIKRNALSLEGIPNSYELGHYQLMKNSFVFEAMDYYRFQFILEGLHNLQFYFSGLWFTTVNITTNAMGLPEQIQTGIAPGIMVRKLLGKHTFKAELNAPLLGLTVRNNYSMSMAQTYEKLSKIAYIKQNLLLQSPFSNQALFADFSYRFTCNKHFVLAAGYHFRYQNNHKPISLTSTVGIYSVSLIYKFIKP